MADTSNPISIPLLQLVSDARSTYGLRHQDFGRYRSHCVAKVHHLRKAVGLGQTQGKSRKYQKKAVEADKVTSDKHLQIVLFDAERSWAHSQLLKSTLDDPSTPPATKHHFAKRLAKASSHAGALLTLVHDPALAPRLSAAHTAQVQAYALVQRGTVAFERGKHAEGLSALSGAYAVLGRLAETAPSATDEALANEVMDEVEPMLRFCAYRLGRDTASGVAAISEEVAAKEMGALVPGWEELSARLGTEGAAEKRESVEIRWRGEVVPVRNAELVGPALKVQEALASLREDEARSKKGGEGAQGKKKAVEAGGAKKEILGARRMGTYDKALLVLSDAEAVAHQLVEDNQIAASKGNTARSEAAARPLTLFHAYIQYHLLSVRLKRDLLLIASSASKLATREAKIHAAETAFVAQTGARDPAVAEGKIRRLRAKALPGLVRVFDTALLSLEAMRDLEAVEMDDELSTTVEARIALVRAQRCKYLSQANALPPSLSRAPASPAALTSAYGSALSLNARAKLYVREARHAAGTLAALASPSAAEEDNDDAEEDLVAPALPLSEEAFAALERALEADEARLAPEWFDANGGAVSGELGVEGLSLDADEGEGEKDGKRKVPFYDVAFNYVAAFDMDAIAARAGLSGAAGAVAGAADAMEEVAQAAAAETDEQAEEEAEKPAKRGWGFGLFGRR
ncbi:signal recognition particle subunit srp68 [Rhodotorula kratochvilovae]